MLRRVVRDVFDENVEAVWRNDVATRGVVQVTLSPQDPSSRRVVGLTASYTGAFEIYFVDLDLGTNLIEYDDAQYMEAILRQLALVGEAYLSGAGRVEQKRGIFRKREILRITVDGNEWTVGRHGGTVYYPGD